jgi:hypothetical protein
LIYLRVKFDISHRVFFKFGHNFCFDEFERFAHDNDDIFSRLCCSPTFVLVFLSLSAADGFGNDGGNREEDCEVEKAVARPHPPSRPSYRRTWSRQK